MVIQTTEENKREEEIYRQEAVELEGVVSELQSQKDKLPDDEERLMESLREKRELCEDRDHRKLKPVHKSAAFHSKSFQHEAATRKLTSVFTCDRPIFVEIREMESRLDSKVSEYQGTLNIYQDALGLKLEVIDNSHVRYVFVCIDPSAHDRTFAVATKFNGGDGLLGMSVFFMQLLRVSEFPKPCEESNLCRFRASGLRTVDNTCTSLRFHVSATECKPTIERFPELKEKLSNDGKLVPFLREMRKEFQKLAVSGH